MNNPRSKAKSPESQRVKKIIQSLFLLLTLDIGHWTLDIAHADPGSSAAQFLKIGVGARAAGMGEAVSANNNDASASYWNPAFLALNPGQQLTASHNNAPSLYQFHYAAYAARIKNLGFGASATLIEYDNITKTNNAGEITGNFGASDQNIALSLAQTWGTSFSAGLSIKNVRQIIDETSGSAMALDVGGLLKKDSWQFALGAANWGTALRFDSESAPLPQNIKAAVSYLYEPQESSDESPLSSINAELWHWRDSGLAWHAGLEHWMATDTPTPETLWLAFRTGYQSERAMAFEPTAAFCVGLGIWYKSFGLDFAFKPSAGLGNIYQLGVMWEIK